MNIHNFQLSSVFQNNAKEYFARPIKAMKYQPGLGIENGFCVHYSSGDSPLLAVFGCTNLVSACAIFMVNPMFGLADVEFSVCDTVPCSTQADSC